MQIDPVEEGRRLAEHYRAMSEGELRELAGDFAVLTETAQRALRQEFQERGMGRPEDAVYTPLTDNLQQSAAEQGDDWAVSADSAGCADPDSADRFVDALGFIGRPPEIVPDTPSSNEEVDTPHEFTWKTLLCECTTQEQAQQLREALKRAGIESWIEVPGRSAYSGYASVDISNPRVLVAADQFDRACAIAAQPIPQEIVDGLKIEVPEFEPPVCPKCGASDPVLESVDPENTWKCEQCGEKWSESAVSAEEEAEQTS